jgi:hydrogenase maturation protease
MNGTKEILVAGLGNNSAGDGAFGAETVRRLAGRGLPAPVNVADYSQRGYDLACSIAEGCDAVILIDAAPPGRNPGKLSLIHPDARRLNQLTVSEAIPVAPCGAAEPGEEPGAPPQEDAGVADDPEGLEAMKRVPLDPANLDPAEVLRLARTLGDVPNRIYVVTCEALAQEPGTSRPGLSGPMEAAVSQAVDLVETLVAGLLSQAAPAD